MKLKKQLLKMIQKPKLLCLVPNIYSRIKYVVDLFPNVRSQAQELAIDAMKSSLQKISFPGVFTIKQL